MYDLKGILSVDSYIRVPRILYKPFCAPAADNITDVACLIDFTTILDLVCILC